MSIVKGPPSPSLFVLDGKSISISLVSSPSLKTTHPGIPRNASEWIKLSCEGGGDMYACAALAYQQQYSDNQNISFLPAIVST